MSELLGFWSYVHKDDETDFGGVANLARDIANNYAAIRGEPLELFLDSDALRWGDQWRHKIDESLANVAFFVPVLTPRFFLSVECRREFEFFLDSTARLGIPQVVLPLLYIDVPALHEDEPEDRLMAASKERQWRDWRVLRFAERQSGDYRQAVHQLALEIAERVARSETAMPSIQQSAGTHQDDEDEPGFIDVVAELEAAMPRWNSALESIGEEVRAIGSIMRAATEDMTGADKSGKGFAARLLIARRVAGELEGPVASIEVLAKTWVDDLYSVDAGVRALMARVPESYGENAQVTLQFLDSIESLSIAADQGLGSIKFMSDALDKLSSQSRDLRPVVRRLKTSLVSMGEAREITEAWRDLVDKTDVPR